MGKGWDSNKGGSKEWIKWLTQVMGDSYRALKPGAHGLVWAIPRTSHWTAQALEAAGFEIRDVVTHLFGSGFPKSLNIGKAIDKAAGVGAKAEKGFNVAGQGIGLNPNKSLRSDHPDYIKPRGITPEAKQWDGFGTALKPASEHWILIRKPISEKTVAKNVLKWGVGGLNIDECRVGTDEKLSFGSREIGDGVKYGTMPAQNLQGRFPANLILSGDAPKMLDEQSGERKSAGKYLDIENAKKGGNGMFAGGNTTNRYAGDSGGASRFFYTPKASKSDRGDGNNHPTVKSIALMEYLIKLVTPPGGTVLDPFMGSGSTGVAARNLDMGFIGIEKELEYYQIARNRIEVSNGRI